MNLETVKDEPNDRMPLVIPPDQISKGALDGLIEEFVLREGTDYGVLEYSLEEKKQHVYSQLKSQKIAIVFDQILETVTLLTQQQFKDRQLLAQEESDQV